MPSKGTLYNLERTNRQLITSENLIELGIDESILEAPQLIFKDDKLKEHKPIGISINGKALGDFPEITAEKRGWLSYMNIGEPIIEERKNIHPPTVDTISSRTYVNRDSFYSREFEDNVDFTISNTITWHIQGEAELTFGTRAMSNLSKMVESQILARGSSDQPSVDVYFKNNATTVGEAEVFAQLRLAIQAAVGGSLTTSSTSTSGTKGVIPANSRVKTLATQRRVKKQYDYNIPITFVGFIAVQYAVPAKITHYPPQSVPPYTSTIVARDINLLGLVGNKQHRVKGLAETVSALEVEHTVFEQEPLTHLNEPLYRQS